MSSGRLKNEQNEFIDYNQQYEDKKVNIIDKPNKLSHMKSYFWFNNKKEIIRALTGSGNFSESALLKVPSYKEVVHDITNYPGLGRDIFCGGITVTQKIDTARINELYQKNCDGFNLNDKTTYQSGTNVLKEKLQFNEIVKAHKMNDTMKTAKGLLVLTGDGETQDDNINLDVFVGNSNVGFDSDDEKELINNEKYKNWLNIIREHPINKKKETYGLVQNNTPRTHTKLYVWYNEKNEILAFWSGSANFSNNCVLNDQPFRGLLFEVSLEEHNWKDDFICKVVGAFKTEPGERIKSFCSN